MSGETSEQIKALLNKRQQQRFRRIMRPKDSGSLNFDAHQFQKPKTNSERDDETALSYRVAEPSSVSGWTEQGITSTELQGMSGVTFTPRRHASAEWAKDRTEVFALLRAVFPKVLVDQRGPLSIRVGFHEMARWHSVITRYFGDGWDAQSVADEINGFAPDGITPEQVETIARAITRRRSGIAANGKPLKGGRGRRKGEPLSGSRGRQSLKGADSTQSIYTQETQDKELRV